MAQRGALIRMCTVAKYSDSETMSIWNPWCQSLCVYVQLSLLSLLLICTSSYVS